MKRLLKFLLPFIAAAFMITGAATAEADLGGEVPSPGNCDYPATGNFGMEFGVYHSDCRFPVEINGSRHVCRYYGAAALGTVGVGVSFMFINASASLTTPV
jgi:hypothetical protein